MPPPLPTSQPGTPGERQRVTGVGRFGARAVLGLLTVVAGGLPFLVLLFLLQRNWEPMLVLDGDVADALNRAVSPNAFLVDVLQLVTDLGGNGAAVYAFLLGTTFLWIREQRRLAAFLAVTGLGLAALVPLTKVLIGRDRPEVPVPIVEIPSNASFPSGHAMISLVTFGALTLVALPLVRRRLRPWLVLAVVVVVIAVGFTRLALGVHFVTDVLAGWALGVAWLAAMTAAFRGWQHTLRAEASGPWDPLEAEVPPGRAAVPGEAHTLPRGHASLIRLALVATAILAGLAALGLLVTGPLADSAVGRFDVAAVRWLADHRTPLLTDVADAVGSLSGTRAVVAVSVAAMVLSRAVTASWRPVVFVLVAVLGELLLYFLAAQVVGRLRPDVADLTEGLPTGASWPSGHAAAAVVIYGSVAALVLRYGAHPRRWWVLLLPVLLPLAIGFTRVYEAAHYPTDVFAGLCLGTGWLLACALLVLGGRRPARVARRGPGAAADAEAYAARDTDERGRERYGPGGHPVRRGSTRHGDRKVDRRHDRRPVRGRHAPGTDHVGCGRRAARGARARPGDVDGELG